MGFSGLLDVATGRSLLQDTSHLVGAFCKRAAPRTKDSDDGVFIKRAYLWGGHVGFRTLYPTYKTVSDKHGAVRKPLLPLRRATVPTIDGCDYIFFLILAISSSSPASCAKFNAFWKSCAASTSCPNSFLETPLLKYASV